MIPDDYPALTAEEFAVVLTEIESDEDHPFHGIAQQLRQMAEYAFEGPLPEPPESPWERDAIRERVRERAMGAVEGWRG